MSDTWLPPGEDPREQPTPPRGERAVLLEYLEHYRTTFELKLDGLDAEQLARRSVPPSTMSLLGLLRHLAAVEHSWHRRVLAGGPELPRLWGKDDARDADFDAVEPTDACVEEAWTAWRAEVAAARTQLAGDDLDRLVDVHGDQIEVRDVVVHLVEEYARHCGHADLLRECIDGRTGQ